MVTHQTTFCLRKSRGYLLFWFTWLNLDEDFNTKTLEADQIHELFLCTTKVIMFCTGKQEKQNQKSTSRWLAFWKWQFSFKVYSFCFRLFCFFWFRVPVGFFIKILFKDNYFKINIKIRFFSHLSCFKNIIYYFLIWNLFFLKDELTRLFHVKSINPIVLKK